MKSCTPYRLLLAIVFMLPLLATSARAQVDPAAEDSLRAVQQIQLEQKQLRGELDRLRSELDRLKNEKDGEERSAAISDIEKRILDAETRLDALERSVGEASGESDEWGEEWEGDEGFEEWEEDWEGDDEWSWWDDSGEEDQFNFSQNIFEKYPGNFPWMFPLTSRLHESFLRYNRVEGVYIGLHQAKRLYWHSQPWIVSTGSLGYGFANHTWRYSLGLYFPIYLEDQIIEIGGEGYSLTDSKDQWSFDRDENTVTSIIAREDYLDYFERRGFNTSASWYYRGEDDLNARASVGYVHDTYANMNRATNWSLFGGDKEFRPNPLINDGNINSIVFSAGVTTLLDLDTRTHGWDAQLHYESAGGFAAGDFEFTQFIADVRRYQPLGEHLNLNMRVRGGMSDGLLPRQRAFELGGPGTLPGYRFKEFSGSHVALLSAELVVRSSIAGNARGWAKNFLRNTNLILFANAGSTNRTGSSDRLVPSARPGMPDVANGAYDVSMTDSFVLDNWKTDAGIAIGSPDGNFRIGAAWRLDRSESPNFVLRFTRPF